MNVYSFTTLYTTTLSALAALFMLMFLCSCNNDNDNNVETVASEDRAAVIQETAVSLSADLNSDLSSGDRLKIGIQRFRNMLIPLQKKNTALGSLLESYRTEKGVEITKLRQRMLVLNSNDQKILRADYRIQGYEKNIVELIAYISAYTKKRDEYARAIFHAENESKSLQRKLDLNHILGTDEIAVLEAELEHNQMLVEQDFKAIDISADIALARVSLREIYAQNAQQADNGALESAALKTNEQTNEQINAAFPAIPQNQSDDDGARSTIPLPRKKPVKYYGD